MGKPEHADHQEGDTERARAVGHCVAKLAEIVGRGEDDRRSLFQIGYNLGRLSELTGLGREAFWDAWKGAVTLWDRAELVRLCRELQARGGASPPPIANSGRTRGDDSSGKGVDGGG